MEKFFQFGKIKSVKIKRDQDGKSLGYGWVNFERV
jgi:hypothetical protein